jgi:hypothetical protein
MSNSAWGSQTWMVIGEWQGVPTLAMFGDLGASLSDVVPRLAESPAAGDALGSDAVQIVSSASMRRSGEKLQARIRR